MCSDLKKEGYSLESKEITFQESNGLHRKYKSTSNIDSSVIYENTAK